MPTSLRVVPFVALVLTTLSTLAEGTGLQGPPTAPAKPDSAEIQQLLASARAAAGAEWQEAFDFICALNPNRVNRPDDPEIEPTRVFDNLYAVGRTGTTVWIVRTSVGLVLIDAGYPDQLDSILLPGMKKLGLDPDQVRYVLVGHGHADHFGGASYFQQRGARVVMAAADWDLLAAAPPAPAGGRGAAAAASLPPPTRDLSAAEGTPIVVGDTTFTPVAIPGHTPGSLGFVFPVREGRTTHVAALFGGSILTPGRLSLDGLKQYIASVEHWADVTRRMNVVVELQNHPLYDGMLARLDRLRSRQSGDANPFVAGSDGYQRFVSVMADCTRVQLARRLL
jgi:metallo-beta-lactamase class B